MRGVDLVAGGLDAAAAARDRVVVDARASRPGELVARAARCTSATSSGCSRSSDALAAAAAADSSSAALTIGSTSSRRTASASRSTSLRARSSARSSSRCAIAHRRASTSCAEAPASLLQQRVRRGAGAALPAGLARAAFGQAFAVAPGRAPRRDLLARLRPRRVERRRRCRLSTVAGVGGVAEARPVPSADTPTAAPSGSRIRRTRRHPCRPARSGLRRPGGARSSGFPSARPRPRTARTGPFDSRSSRSISAARCDMFLKILSRSSCVRALERDDQRLGLHFAQQRLDAAVVDVEDVVEHEHLVHDLLRQSSS